MLRKAVGQYDAWREAELVPERVARADKVVRKSLVQVVGELAALIRDGE